MKNTFVIILIVSTLILAPLTLLAEDFHCNEKIISTGDEKAEVYFKCGDPAWKETRTEEVIHSVEQGYWIKRYVEVEEWLYNFGPTRFMRILTFRDDRLVDIDTDDYGYDRFTKYSDSECLKRVELGDRKPEVVIKCGLPSFTDFRIEEHIKRFESNRILRVNVRISQWYYDFGPDRLVRVFHFKDGKLAQVTEKEYGYGK